MRNLCCFASSLFFSPLAASKTTAIDFDDHQATSRKESLRRRTRLHRYRCARLSHECLPLLLLSRRMERKRPVREGDDRSSPSSSATSLPDVRLSPFPRYRRRGHVPSRLCLFPDNFSALIDVKSFPLFFVLKCSSRVLLRQNEGAFFFEFLGAETETQYTKDRLWGQRVREKSTTKLVVFR